MQTFSGEQGMFTLDVALRGSEFVVGPLFFLLGIFSVFSGFPSSKNLLIHVHLIFTQAKFISDK